MLVPLSSYSSQEYDDLAQEMTCSAFNSTMKTGQVPSYFSFLDAYLDLRLANSPLRSSFSRFQKTVEKTGKPLKSGEHVVASEHNQNRSRKRSDGEREEIPSGASPKRGK